MGEKNKIVIICGHYGCGKTNLCLNLAKESADNKNKTYVIDMDIVNPYFRSSDYAKTLEDSGVRLISPNGAGLTIDIPSLSASIASAFSNEDATVFFDVGGDDAGATALGAYREQIKKHGYEMIYVMNMYRMQTATPQGAIEILKEIEAKSGLEATAVVNNSHLAEFTTIDTVTDSIGYKNEVSTKLNLPCLYTTMPNFVKHTKLPQNESFKIINREVSFI